MISQIARELIARFGEKGCLLSDPNCGTGTSLVETRIASIDTISTDIIPTARFVEKVQFIAK